MFNKPLTLIAASFFLLTGLIAGLIVVRRQQHPVSQAEQAGICPSRGETGLAGNCGGNAATDLKVTLVWQDVRGQSCQGYTPYAINEDVNAPADFRSLSCGLPQALGSDGCQAQCTAPGGQSLLDTDWWLELGFNYQGEICGRAPDAPADISGNSSYAYSVGCPGSPAPEATPTPTSTEVSPTLPLPSPTSPANPTSTLTPPPLSPVPSPTPRTPTPTPAPAVFGCEKLTVNRAEGTPQDKFTFVCRGRTNLAGDVIDQVRFTIINLQNGAFETITQTTVEKVGEDPDGTQHFEARLENYQFENEGDYEVRGQVHSRDLDQWHPEFE